MTDREMRGILIEYLMIKNRHYRIFQEKNIGSSVCDVMLVTDRLCGFEIKSDSDNLERIGRQVEAYERFFDENTIVVGEKYRDTAAKKVPASWGILCIEHGKVSPVRIARKNDKASLKSKLSILWLVELKNLLTENNLPAYTFKSKEFIIDRLEESVPAERLSKQLVRELMERDYSLYSASDFTIRSGQNGGSGAADGDAAEDTYFIGDLADRLSEEDLSQFTLDKWMEIYRRAAEVRQKKEEAARQRAESRKPHAVTYRDICVYPGVPWVSVNIIQDFIREVFKINVDRYTVNYEPITGHWSCTRSSYMNKEVQSIYGLPGYNALRILEAALNLREIKIYDGSKYDEGMTLAALEKQKKILDAFAEWVWKDEDRRWEIEEAYSKMFSGCEVRHYDGSALAFPGMNKDVRLFDYQKDAVQKIISTPNTLLAFDVGAGKTYIMIAAAMQMRASGLSEKNLFVVPNNIVGQWEQMFLTLYPAAKVLAIEPRAFTPEKRLKVLRQMRDGDYAGIIIAYSCFEMIPLSRKYLTERMQRELAVLDAELQSYRGTFSYNTTPLKNCKKSVTKAMTDLINAMEPDSAAGLAFEDLHINTLFLDEAHNYKNIPIKTGLKNLRGINTKGSAKCFEMLLKVHSVQQNNGGRGAVFATGTPLSNSISDTYNMQMYLQYEDLKKRSLNQFDNWVKTFARVEAVCEIDVDTSGFRMVNRFTRFVNLPELSKLFSEVSVFYAMDGVDLPERCEYKNCLIDRSAELTDYMQRLYTRTENIRLGKVAKYKDNMLKVTTDGRKAALDMRLAGGCQPYDEHNKLFVCVKNVAQIYRRYPGCTQLVFCDISTPQNGSFNVYGELRCRLIGEGIPAKEIAFIHSYKNEEQKQELYQRVNEGEVRVLLGSTFKLGIGANVQKKLKAVHHLDVPWRPADMVQREGRIMRRGNSNDEVFIFRYIIKGSFDSYSWQILENKQKFISQFLSGTEYQRSIEDLENVELTYAQVKALALSQPLMKEYVEKKNELRAAQIALAAEEDIRRERARQINELEENISKTEERIALTEGNAKYAAGLDIAGMQEEISACAQTITKNLHTVGRQKLCSLAEFEIYTPERQSPSKPSLYIGRGGAEYSVEFGASLKGNITRLKNFLRGFEKLINNMKKFLREQQKRKQLLLEQQKGDPAAAQKAERLKAELAELFQKLRASGEV